MAGAMSLMILTVMAVMAQVEREIMLERQREGMARAKAERHQGYSRSAGSSGSAGAAAGTARPRDPSGCIRRRTDLRPGSSDLLRRAVCTPLLCAPIWPVLWPRKNPRLVRFGRGFLGGLCQGRLPGTGPEPRTGAGRPL